MQTFFGNDAATVRTRNLVPFRAIVFIEEERSGDAEVKHTPESVGYFAIEQGDILASAAAARVSLNSNGSAGSLKSDNSADGNLWWALGKQESWDEVALSYSDASHDHDDQYEYMHASNASEVSNCNHGDGCGCGACRIGGGEASQSRSFDFDANRLDLIWRRFASRLQIEDGSLSRNLFRSGAFDHIVNSSSFQNLMDNIRQRRVDSFFEQDLGLFGNRHRK